MTRTHSSRMKQAIVATACAATMALSGFSAFSPKNETRFGVRTANAQGVFLPPGNVSPTVPGTKYGPPPSALDKRIARRRYIERRRECHLDLEQIKTGSVSERVRSAEVIWFFCGDMALPELLEALNDNSWKVRAKAAEELGHEIRKRTVFGGGCAYTDDFVLFVPRPGFVKAVRPLIRSLNDWHADVRIAAADSLGQIGAKQAFPKLTELSRNDPDEGVRKAATGAMDEINRLTNPKPFVIKDGNGVPIKPPVVDDK